MLDILSFPIFTVFPLLRVSSAFKITISYYSLSSSQKSTPAMFNPLQDCVPGFSGRLERLTDEAGHYISDAAEMAGYSFQNLVNDQNRAPNRLEQQLGRARRAVTGTVQPWAQNVGNRLATIINGRIAAGTRRNGNDAPQQPAQPLPTEPLPAQQQQSDPGPLDARNVSEIDLTSLLSSEPPFDPEPASVNWDEANNEFDDDEPNEFDNEPDNSANEHDYMLTEQSLSRLLGYAALDDGSYMHSSVEDYVVNVDDQNNYASADFASVAENNVVESNVVENVADNVVEGVVTNVVASSSASGPPARTPCVSPPRPQMPPWPQPPRRKKRTCSQASTEVDSHAGSNELTRCRSLTSVFTLVNESDADSDEEDSYFVI